MKIEAKSNCPLDNFNPCRQLDCAWFMKVQENSQRQYQTGAAVESFRNEMVKANENSQKMLLATLTDKEKKINQDLILENDK
jgi:hypothetical protein